MNRLKCQSTSPNAVSTVIGQKTEIWTFFDPEDPDDCLNHNAMVSSWLPQFGQHDFFAAIFTGSFFRVKSIERLATHPVWTAHLHRGNAILCREVVPAMRELRAIFKEHGIPLPRNSPSVRMTGQSLLVSWVWNDGDPGIVTWSRDGRREERVYFAEELEPIPEMPDYNLPDNPDDPIVVW